MKTLFGWCKHNSFVSNTVQFVFGSSNDFFFAVCSAGWQRQQHAADDNSFEDGSGLPVSSRVASPGILV